MPSVSNDAIVYACYCSPSIARSDGQCYRCGNPVQVIRLDEWLNDWPEYHRPGVEDLSMVDLGGEG